MTDLRNHLGQKAGLFVLLLCGGAVLALALVSSQQPPTQAGASGARPTSERAATAPAVRVKTVRPKREPALEVTVEQPANVEAYYRAELHALVAGPVKFIEKDVGDRVTAGERLVEIEEPNLVEESVQKQALVEQARHELRVADADVRIARAEADAAAQGVRQCESQAEAAGEELEVHRTEHVRERVKQITVAVAILQGIGVPTPLAIGPPSVGGHEVLDERWKAYRLARATRTVAEAAVLKAKAQLEAAQQKVERALAAVDLKKSLIKVAEADRDRTLAAAKAQRELAIIRAPFDGVIAARNVDPGSFVANAAVVSPASPLLVIKRIDIVTVTMGVPDAYAPYVGKDTEAIIELNELRGVVLRSRLTRITPSLQANRTLQVEVDLYNGTAQQYQAFLAHAQATNHAGLKSRMPPLFPTRVTAEKEADFRQLLPGMYGKMRLILRKFKNVYLLPSTAVVRQSGMTYIYQVVEGTAVRVPVVVDMDDGTLVSLRLLVQESGQRVRRDLTGREEVVISNQGELSDGQGIQATSSDW